ncbi:ribonuclease H-like domain-containing protein [Rhizophagus irregularis DAOM 181602=DAOM 197198]|nr:ribonuclease H-like domain-containing protein [Rhizophagus irregularis DAOM 181602=DAOM 197198]
MLEDINKGESVGSSKFSAFCKYCKITWKRDKISKLEEHLSNHCKNAPATIVRKYMSKILERQDKVTKKRKLPSGQQYMDNYHDSTDLFDAKIIRINRALIKFFVSCEISFHIVEHPFFINSIKELNGKYDPPTREIKEYLYQLSDLSKYSHTAKYLSSVIEKVIVDIGVNQISAVVSDNASNIRKACEIIQDKFPTIENVRRIAHYINLIACNIVKEEFGDHLLR